METAHEATDDVVGPSFLADNTQYLLADVGDEMDDDGQDDDEDCDRTGVLREQDRFLPIANVARLMKKSIPVTGKIAKDARECVQECVSEFVSFITSEASDRCHQEKRKTINGEDILFAMSSLGFDNYIEPLKIYLQKYRDITKGDRVLSGDESSLAGETSSNGGAAAGGASSSGSFTTIPAATVASVAGTSGGGVPDSFFVKVIDPLTKQ